MKQNQQMKGRKNIKKRKKSLNIVHVVSFAFIAYFFVTFLINRFKFYTYIYSLK